MRLISNELAHIYGWFCTWYISLKRLFIVYTLFELQFFGAEIDSCFCQFSAWNDLDLMANSKIIVNVAIVKSSINDRKTCISGHKPYHIALNPHHDGIIRWNVERRTPSRINKTRYVFVIDVECFPLPPTHTQPYW